MAKSETDASKLIDNRIKELGDCRGERAAVPGIEQTDRWAGKKTARLSASFSYFATHHVPGRGRLSGLLSRRWPLANLPRRCRSAAKGGAWPARAR